MARFSAWSTASAAFLLWAATAIAAQGQAFQTIGAFNIQNGANPDDVILAQGTDGAFYGTAYAGGDNGGGTLFRIMSFGGLTSISLCEQTNCPDGSGPHAGPTLGTDGNFYGTAEYGGAYGALSGGTVIKVTPAGVVTTLYSFCSRSTCPDGLFPVAPLVQGNGDDFYGTTAEGGANSGGTVFKITVGGALTTLYSFCAKTNCADGESPNGLVQASDGNFYGTTVQGGPYYHGQICYPGCGTVFRIAPGGALTTIYNFCTQSGLYCTDGNYPEGELIQGKDGNLYGTTSMGGTENGGTVFKITTDGVLTTIYDFGSDVYSPFAGLVQATTVTFTEQLLAGVPTDPVRFSRSPRKVL